MPFEKRVKSGTDHPMDGYADIGLEHMDPALRAMLIERTRKKQADDLKKVDECHRTKISKEDYLKFVDICNQNGNWVQNHQKMITMIESLIVNRISADDIDESIPSTMISFGMKPAFIFILKKYVR